MKTANRGFVRKGAMRSALLIVMLPAIASGQLVRVGSEFQVNSHTTSLESTSYGARLGVAADGSFVVMWQDDEDLSVSVRRFDSSGAPVGTDLQVVAPSYSYRPTMAVVPDGHFVVVWEKADGSDYGVTAQHFSSAGSALGTELQVNTYLTDEQGSPEAESDGLGNVLIAWTSRIQDGDRRGIFAQRFDSSGAAAGTEFQVNSYTFGSQAGIVVAGDPAGGFVVAWSDYRYNGFTSNTLARRYDSAGNLLGSEFQLNAYTSCDLGAGRVDLSIGNGGGLVVSYDCGGRDGSYSGVFARRFASSGAAIGSEFQVNVHTEDRQHDGVIAHDANDGFAIIWFDDAPGIDSDLFGRRYDSSGSPSGAAFQVNVFTYFNQAYPRIAPRSAGEFVVVWTSEHQDDYLTGVFGARLAPVGKAIGGKKLLIKTPPSGPAGNKLVLLSKDAAIAPPASVVGDPRCAPLGSGSLASGAQLAVEGPGGTFAIDLPCAGWSADADRTKFTYKDATGATCKIVKIKQGRLLKAVCAGTQVAYTLGAAQDEVRVSLRTGNPDSVGEHCLNFGAATAPDVKHDGSNGKLYKAIDAGAPDFCP